MARQKHSFRRCWKSTEKMKVRTRICLTIFKSSRKLYEAQGKYEAAEGLPGEPWMIWLDSAGREVATQRRKSFTAEADHCRGTPKV